MSEADALAAFKKASEEINALVKEGKAAGNPAEGMPKMSAALEKMQAISLDGLPEDLKTSFTAAKDGFKDLTAAFADMPKSQEEAMAWLQKTMTDPAFGEKMQKLSETGKAATAKFKEVAAKYGITIDE